MPKKTTASRADSLRERLKASKALGNMPDLSDDDLDRIMGKHPAPVFENIAEINENGHSTPIPDHAASGGFMEGISHFGGLSDDSQDRFKAAFDKGVLPFAEPIVIAPRYPGWRGRDFSCTYCAQQPTIMTDGVDVWLSEPCSLPDGFSVTTELAVPSGKIVFRDDLRFAYPGVDGDEFDIMTQHGLRDTTLAYAKLGLSHGFVGNSCPSIYKNDGGSLRILNAEQDDDYNDIDPDGTRVGFITTDLWWYSLADADDCQERIARHTDRNIKLNTLDVEPGIYTITYHGCEKSFDWDWSNKLKVYADIAWTRKV